MNLHVEFESVVKTSETTLKLIVGGKEMAVARLVLGLSFAEQLEVVNLWNLVG